MNTGILEVVNNLIIEDDINVFNKHLYQLPIIRLFTTPNILYSTVQVFAKH